MKRLQLTALGSFTFQWHPQPPRWQLQPGEGGQASIPISETPFVIGRAFDCHVVLPSDEELAKSTSRWHCHVVKEGELYLLRDGSVRPIPETGKLKPSVSGTYLDGRRLEGAQPLQPGSTLAVGPWRFTLREAEEAEVDIDGVLTRIESVTPRDLSPSDPKVRDGFARLHELFKKLQEIHSVDECLAVILRYAIDRIANAQVAAILQESPGSAPRARAAWSRARGREFSFQFSSGLYGRLPPDKAFLLESRIEDSTKSQLEENISSGLIVPLSGHRERLGVLYMDNRDCSGSFQEDDLYLANALANLAALQLIQERQAFLSRLDENMSHYFGPEVVRLIVEETAAGRPLQPGVKERDVSVLFIDIEGFSAFCRDRKPAEIVDLLNPYFELAAACIQRHGGHVDKFIGDGVMGVFGAHPFFDPRTTAPNHAAQSLRAAREMMETWSRMSLERWGTRIPLRAGVNSGTVMVGNIGYASRLEYSVIGDAVNLAARLEKLAPPNGIAVSERTKRLAGGEFEFRDNGSAEIKGFGLLTTWVVTPG